METEAGQGPSLPTQDRRVASREGKLEHEAGAGGDHRGPDRASWGQHTSHSPDLRAIRGPGQSAARRPGADAPITSKQSDGSRQLVAGLFIACPP